MLIEVQLAVTVIAVAVDIGVVFRGFWVPLMRETRPEDRPYLFKALARFARASHEEEARPKDGEELTEYVEWRKARADVYWMKRGEGHAVR